MFEIVLYEPEIPANTGNIVRLCANAGARLHLVLPAGFTLGDRGLRRAGLDCHDIAPVTETFPMSRVNDALDHLRAGKARYRVVVENDLG